MIFRCDRSELQETLATVTRAISTRASLDILDCVLFELYGNTLTLSCYNETLGIQCSMQVSGEDDGRYAIPGRMLTDIVRRMPGDDMRIRAAQTGLITLSCSQARMTLQSRDAELFPTLPLEVTSDPVVLPPVYMRDLIRQTSFSIAVGEERPVLTGALMEIEDDIIRLVALDGFRMAISERKLQAKYTANPIIIPGKALGEIAHLLGDEQEETAQIHIESRRMVLFTHNAKLVARLQEGEFIKYRQILPASFSTKALIDKELMSDAIDRASLYAREGKSNLVKMSAQDDAIIITANSEMGEAYENLPCFKEGGDLDIAFNVRYITDIFKAIDGEKVLMQFNSNVSPCVIEPAESEYRLVYLVLPVRMFGT